jgi:aryl-alcohol dehydrogenase-like predicted oxidoreductase
MIPVVGASTVAQLDEILGAADLRLDDDARERLEAAGHRADHWAARTPTPTGYQRQPA